MIENKSAVIAFLGNIRYDSRTSNLSASLKVNGLKVSTICFDWLDENSAEFGEGGKIFYIKKGGLSILFYCKFAFLLTKYLLTSNANLIFAEDIYTLPFVVLVGKIKRAKIFYDARELFAHLAGLKKRNVIQFLLRLVEAYFIHKADYVITTGEMDSDFLRNRYKLSNIIVLRNLPRYCKPERTVDLRSRLNISGDQKILLYQGVILHGRGLTAAIKALTQIRGFSLVVIGGGEEKNYYENLSEKFGVADRVFFLGRIPQEKLFQFTPSADIGLALIENLSLSYYYALPNKLFEYIMAEVPVLSSDLPQMKEIIEKYNVGRCINVENENELIQMLREFLHNDNLMKTYRQNCRKASEVLNWENEIQNLLRLT